MHPPRPGRRRLPVPLRRSIVLALLVLLPCLAAAPAAGHAFVAQESPAPGAILATAPVQVRLSFTERLEPAYSFVHVTAANGSRVDVDGGRVPADEPNVLVAGLIPLVTGNYTVSWSTLSVDTHSASGTYTFAVGAALPGEAAAAGSVPHPHGPLGRILYLAGLLSVPGILLVAWRIVPRDPRYLRELHAYAAAMAVLGTVGAAFVYLDAAEPTGAFLGYLLNTRSGPLLLAAFAAMGAAGAVLVLSVRAPRLGHAITALVLAAVAVLCSAATSHAAALTSGATLAVALDALHLAAAAVWVGGVVGLALWLPAKPALEAGHAVARFSPWALAGVAVLLLAGLAGSTRHLGAPSDLWSTFYGTMLLAKMLLVVLLVGLGAMNRFRVGPALRAGTMDAKPLRRAVAVEVLLMLLAVVATSLLTAAVPPTQLA